VNAKHAAIMNTTQGIAEFDIEEIVTSLNILLADGYVLYTKTRNTQVACNLTDKLLLL